ncbi:hypothetical protein ACJ73_01555 [Blastomyces percursus]|uniref:Uncharacterized protein n=1 Tax=Blastomyces percursus TaxID=1658174 RepID=A0A1J9QEW0_9EURO|nr:hypothetical protein ACJ73_01555 [Blastomyces percursus]
MIRRSSVVYKLRFLHRPPPMLALSPGIRYTWTGSTGKDHSLGQSKRGNTTDPITKGSAGGLKEKEEATKGTGNSKSNATTERNNEGSTKNAEKEFPEAPRPIIGMADERGKKGK